MSFEKFWTAWPSTARKVNKAGCRAKWIKLALDIEAETILKHVEAMKQTDQWRRGFEPMPMTYLNQLRWQDGIPAEVANIGKVRDTFNQQALPVFFDEKGRCYA